MKNMKDREAFFAISIIVILIGFYMLLVKTIGVKFGDNLFHISVISDGIFLIIMGIAMVIVSSREWDSEKRKK
jgi:ABC-type transport system involved in cytochrome c biogenesis permease component